MAKIKKSKIKCLKCNNIWKIYLNAMTAYLGVSCPKCGEDKNLKDITKEN